MSYKVFGINQFKLNKIVNSFYFFFNVKITINSVLKIICPTVFNNLYKLLL